MASPKSCLNLCYIVVAYINKGMQNKQVGGLDFVLMKTQYYFLLYIIFTQGGPIHVVILLALFIV